jgi:hypothetical protein
MLIRPELQALRGDDTPQRKAQSAYNAVHEAWRGQGPGLQLEAELASLAGGAELDDLPLLSALFSADEASAQEFADRLVRTMLRQLEANPLGQTPLRFSSDETITSMLVARHGTASLALQVIDGAGLARRPDAVSASFVPAETWERVLVGTAQACRIRIESRRADGANLAFEEILLSPGKVRHRIGKNEIQQLRHVPTALVILKLQRRTASLEPAREYLLTNGSLAHQAAGSPRESRLELTAALLGRMARTDAAPLLAAMAEEEGGQSLRWQSLRECLALDTAQGFGVLCRIARRTDDPLSGPAGKLCAQLLETYPQLAGVSQCLA